MDHDVVIGIDPHKASWSAAVVDSRHQLLGELRVSASRTGYRELRRLARRWPNVRWAIEGSNGLGRPLTQRLIDDGITVVDVPSKLSSRIRELSTGHGRKTDQVDARSVAVAALTGADRQHHPDEYAEILRLLSEHRDELVRRRTQVINRLHVLLCQLLDGGAPASLTADHAATLLGRVRRLSGVRAIRRALAVELVAEVRRLDKNRRRGQPPLRCTGRSRTLAAPTPRSRAAHAQLARQWRTGDCARRHGRLPNAGPETREHRDFAGLLDVTVVSAEGRIANPSPEIHPLTARVEARDLLFVDGCSEKCRRRRGCNVKESVSRSLLTHLAPLGLELSLVCLWISVRRELVQVRPFPSHSVSHRCMLHSQVAGLDSCTPSPHWG